MRHAGQRVAIILFLAGCGFHALDNHGMGGDGGSDGGSSPTGDGGSSSDLSAGGGGGDIDMARSDNSCPLPHLIITVADMNGTGGGQLVRVPLDGSQSTCTTLKGQGLLGARLAASTYLAPGLIATGESNNNTIYVVDANSDLIQWKKQPSLAALGQLFDAFPMKDGNGNDCFAVAFVQDGPVFSELRSWDANGTEVAKSPWCLSSSISCTGTNLMLSNYILGVAANPLNPAHFLAVDGTNNVAGLDVNPALPNTKTLIPGNSDPLGAMYAITANGKLRVAWRNYKRTGSTPPAVDYYTDTGAGGSPVVHGPLRCQSTCTTFSRVVPDPTSATAFFLLCDGTSPNGNVVMHLQSDGTCTTVFDGSTLASNYELSHLAIAQ
jgi:hypothetical protein